LLNRLTFLTPTVAIMGTAIKYPVPDRVKPSFVICDIQALWRSGMSERQSATQPWPSECPDVKNYKWRLNAVWHRMLYGCTHTALATVRVKGLTGTSPRMLAHRGYKFLKSVYAE